MTSVLNCVLLFIRQC